MEDESGKRQQIPENENNQKLSPDDLPVLKLHAPSRYSLTECLQELKFGRTSIEQNFLQECIDNWNSEH